MEIPSNSILSTIKSTSLSPALEHLKNGQQLNIKIIDQSPSSKETIIQLGNKLYRATTNINLSIGENIKVEVQKSSATLTLNIKQPQQNLDIISPSLRLLLPKQSSIELFQQPLKQLNISLDKRLLGKTLNTSDSPLVQLKILTEKIIHNTPNKQLLSTASGFKNALQNSGLFLETHLKQAISQKTDLPATSNTVKPLDQRHNIPTAQALLTLSDQLKSTDTRSNTPIQLDLKANLIKLITLLKNWPTQQQSSKDESSLAKHQQNSRTTHQTANQLPSNIDSQVKELLLKAEGSLAKTTLNQLSSLAEQTPNKQVWQIEIPFYNNQIDETIYIKIEHEKNSRKAKEDQTQWSVSLEISPPKLGLIKNKLTLNGQQINSQFWTENSKSSSLIREHLDLLKDKFIKANLIPKTIDIQNNQGPIFQTTPSAQSILREKA